MPRIDKVRLDNYYNGYQNRSTPVRRTDDTQAPLPFDPGEKGVVYEPSHAEPAKLLQETEAAKEAGKPAELTEEMVRAETGEEPRGSLTAWLRELGGRLLTFLKGVWSNIWNGPEAPAEAPAAEAEETEAAEVTAETAPAEAARDELSEIIADHDLDRLVRFVTADGEKKPARSTDLLTIYNRYGRVNTVDPSDRKKILEGNFNDIKL